MVGPKLELKAMSERQVEMISALAQTSTFDNLSNLAQKDHHPLFYHPCYVPTINHSGDLL